MACEDIVIINSRNEIVNKLNNSFKFYSMNSIIEQNARMQIALEEDLRLLKLLKEENFSLY